MGKFILNVDTGVDDALAIILMAKYGLNPEFIVAASGNSTIENTYNNTRGVVSLLGLNIPVYRGSFRPLAREPYMEDFHGERGISGYKFKKFSPGSEKNGIIKMYEALKNDKFTIISTSPLTSLGILLSLDPSIYSQINEIIIMGGAFRLNSFGNGNMGDAEFNVFYDPEAAKIVFNSGIKLRAIPLDITMNPDFAITAKDMKNSPNDSPCSDFTKAVISDMIKRHGKFELHDPIAAFSYIKPEAFNYINGDIIVDGSGKTRIMEKISSSMVAVSLNKELFNSGIKEKLLH
ncbi:MAG: nucleoside hydrolase [Ferroplasma sp.]